MTLEDIGYHLAYLPDGIKEVYVKNNNEIDFDEKHHSARKYYYGAYKKPYNLAFDADEIKAICDMMEQKGWIKK